MIKSNQVYNAMLVASDSNMEKLVRIMKRIRKEEGIVVSDSPWDEEGIGKLTVYTGGNNPRHNPFNGPATELIYVQSELRTNRFVKLATMGCYHGKVITIEQDGVQVAGEFTPREFVRWVRKANAERMKCRRINDFLGKVSNRGPMAKLKNGVFHQINPVIVTARVTDIDLTVAHLRHSGSTEQYVIIKPGDKITDGLINIMEVHDDFNVDGEKVLKGDFKDPRTALIVVQKSSQYYMRDTLFNQTDLEIDGHDLAGGKTWGVDTPMNIDELGQRIMVNASTKTHGCVLRVCLE